MCVGVVEAGQESSCATRFVANGEMWLTIHFCWEEGHEGCIRKNPVQDKGQFRRTRSCGMWSVGRGPPEARLVRFKATATAKQESVKSLSRLKRSDGMQPDQQR